MPQSLSNVVVHLVFPTKDRQPFLANDEIRAEMHRQLGETSNGTFGIDDHCQGNIDATPSGWKIGWTKYPG